MQFHAVVILGSDQHTNIQACEWDTATLPGLETHGSLKGRVMKIKIESTTTKQYATAGIAALAIALSNGAAAAVSPESHTK